MRVLFGSALAVVAVGLIMLTNVGTASAATLCKANQTPCAVSNHYPSNTEIKLSLAPGTKLTKDWGFATLECGSSSLTGKTETTGGSSSPVELPLSTSFGSCGCSSTVVKSGRLSVQSIEGVMNGSVTWSGFEIKENCGFFECTLGPEVKKGIALKGGTEATLKFEHTTMPRQSGTCESPRWTGQYKLTSPTPVYVAGSSSESLTGEGVLCQFESSPCATPFGTGTPINAALKTGTMSVIDAGFPVIKCEAAALSGEIANAGGTGEPVLGPVGSLTFGSCNCKVTVLKSGRFSVSWTSGVNGKLALEGFEIASDCGGKECAFAGNVKEGITLDATGIPPLIKFKEAPVPKKSGVAECNSTAKWSAEYEVTSPEWLTVTQN